MLRIFYLLSIFFFTLEAACSGGYNSCVEKIIDSHSIVKDTLQIPVSTHTRLVFSHTPPRAKILKHDPFLSLYLIEDAKGFAYPFKINNNLSLAKVSVNETKTIAGKILKRQVGLNSFATFSNTLVAPAVLTNSCCNLEGIVTPEGIIEIAFIERFLNTNNSSYGDIGIRLKDEKKGVIVTAVDPFIKNNPFHKGDRILFLDGKKGQSSASVMRNILFAPVGSAHEIKIQRASQTLDFRLTTTKRAHGGYMSDTFLEHYGWVFDNNLYITKMNAKAHNYGLKIGDRLLSVNGKSVKTQQDVLENIAYLKDYIALLFEREGFQFFVNVN